MVEQTSLNRLWKTNFGEGHMHSIFLTVIIPFWVIEDPDFRWTQYV